jgi:RNA polymerase sigma-70 factor (ECF subfamily)
MLRVTRVTGEGGRDVLRVEGRLTQDTTEELRAACEAPDVGQKAMEGPLELDVAGLRFVDAAGARLLRRLQGRGARLVGGSPFVRELLRGDDVQALEAAIRMHGGRMLATARRFVGSDDEARDVVQAALLAAVRAIDDFTGSAQLSTWLHRIVINTALMRLRSRRRRPEGSIDDLLPRFADDGHWAEPQSQWETPVDVQLDRRQTRARVRAAIDRLPAAHRSVLLLRDIEELDTDETAMMLGIKPNAVRTRLHRARQALRTLLMEGASDEKAAPATPVGFSGA